MIFIKTDEEIDLLRESNDLLSRALGAIVPWIKSGVSLREIDRVAFEYIKDHGAEPGFLGYGGFPNTLCLSLNDQVVHGIPSDICLEEGDILSVDCGVVKNGFYADSAYTFPVGEVTPEVMALLKTTKESLYKGIEKAVAGNRIGDIASTIQDYCEKRGYSIVRELCGHGIGRNLHESPEIPNYGRRGTGPLLKSGMALAIEPMVNLGSRNIVTLSDGWTIRTKDRKPSAHYEHSVVVGQGQAEILSTFAYVEQALGDKAI